MKKFFKIFKKNTFLFVAGVVFILFLFSGIVTQCQIQNRFGFIVSTPYIGSRINGCEVIMVIASDDGGAFHKAGIRSGDVLLDTTFYWLQNYLGSFDLPSGTGFQINTIPSGYKATNFEELSELPKVTRVVIAP